MTMRFIGSVMATLFGGRPRLTEPHRPAATLLATLLAHPIDPSAIMMVVRNP